MNWIVCNQETRASSFCLCKRLLVRSVVCTTSNAILSRCWCRSSSSPRTSSRGYCSWQCRPVRHLDPNEGTRRNWNVERRVLPEVKVQRKMENRVWDCCLLPLMQLGTSTTWRPVRVCLLLAKSIELCPTFCLMWGIGVPSIGAWGARGPQFFKICRWTPSVFFKNLQAGPQFLKIKFSPYAHDVGSVLTPPWQILWPKPW